MSGLGRRYLDDHANQILGSGDFTLPGFDLHYAPDLGLEPKHLELRLQVDLETRSVSGNALWTLEVRREGARQITLNAMEFSVHEVSDVDGRTLHWRHDGKVIHVRWDASHERGHLVRLRIRWTADTPKSGMFFGGVADGSDPRVTWMATDHETERARYWLPCVDYPNVRTSVDVHLTAAQHLTALGPGRLIDRVDNGNDTATTHWCLEEPCPSYLLCLVVGELVEADGGEYAGVPMKYYAPAPYSSEDLMRSFGPTPDMMAWMTSRLGVEFPYPKYYQVAIPGIGGAMENISLTSWDDAFVVDDVLHAERGWLVDLINLHEMAHSYFGDLVVCRDYAHAWLKEGWATYMESVWLDETKGTDDYHHQMWEEKIAYRSEADERYVRPVMTRAFNSSFQMYDQHLYPGSAWRIHMLRHLLGESDFWEGVGNYLTKYSHRVVETDDFRHELEAVSGRSLAQFFDQWIHSPGYPRLKAVFRYDGEMEHAKIHLEQTQMGERNGQTVPVFNIDVEVAILSAKGEWSTHVVRMDSPQHGLTVAMTEAPTQVVIDPEMKLLHSLEFDPGLDMSISSVHSAPTVNGRIHAAETLGKGGAKRGLLAIQDAFKSEKHWGVRVALARALAKAKNLYAAELLAELLLWETDPKVMQTLATQCGQYRSDAVESALVEWLDRPVSSHWARGTALKSLGYQRGDAHLERLMREGESQAWWGWVRRDADVALGKTRTHQAFEHLLAKLKASVDVPQVKMMTALGLVEACQWLPDQQRNAALEAIGDSAEGQGNRYCMTVARALVSLGESGGLPLIEELGNRMAHQWQPMFQKTASALKKKLEATSKSDKSFEELVATVRKLEARLAAIEAERGD